MYNYFTGDVAGYELIPMQFSKRRSYPTYLCELATLKFHLQLCAQ